MLLVYIINIIGSKTGHIAECIRSKQNQTNQNIKINPNSGINVDEPRIIIWKKEGTRKMNNVLKDFPKVNWSKDDQTDINIENYFRLVTTIMKKYTPPRGLDWDDMFQIGVIALIKAKNKFDPDRGIQFSTFAGKCIHNEYLMELRRSKSAGNRFFNESYSMDVKILETDEDSGIELHSLVKDPLTVEDIVLTSLAMDDILHDWKPKNPLQKRAGDFHMAGLSQPTMSMILGVSQSYVSRLVTSYKQRAATYFGVDMRKPHKRVNKIHVERKAE